MSIINLFKKHKLTVVFAAIAVVTVVFAANQHLKNNSAVEVPADIQEVSLIPVADYRQEKTVDLDNAIVESLGQADLKAQISAPVMQVNVKLGDPVAAGQTLVQLQNNDIKAQLEQAQAGLAAANAKLDELQRGARAEDIAISQTSSNETRMALINSIKDSYAKSDDAIHNHIDKFFTNPRESSAAFRVEVNVSGTAKSFFNPIDNDLAIEVQKQKYELESVLSDWQTAVSGLDSSTTDSKLQESLALSKKNLQTEIDFLNNMAPLVNGMTAESSSVKTVIDGYKTEFSAARSTVSGALASLQGAQTSWQTAQKALDYKLAGASAEQLEQGKAAVAQAAASVDTLKATLAKTSIVSPINGRISYIDVNVGEFASAGTLVASVVNPSALQVKTYVSETDLPSVTEGARATIGNNARGIVEAVAPAVDSQTKKAQINIIVTDKGDPSIVVGQNVGVKIASKDSENAKYYLLPIEAIQFTGNETYALSVGPNSTLEKVPVATGQIVGEKIYVTSGIDENSAIVSSVRGLAPGQKVTVKK